MKEIQLTQGKVALIDDEDFDRVASVKWHATKSRKTFYAVHSFRHEKGPRNIPMQCYIMGYAAEGFLIDHRNGNGLDNRKENLRFVTYRHNSANTHRKKKSQYMGVSWNTQQGKWVVKVLLNGRMKWIGSFSNEIDAAKRYRKFLDDELVVICSKMVAKKKGQATCQPLDFLEPMSGIEPLTC